MVHKNADLETLEQFFDKFPQYELSEKERITKAWNFLSEICEGQTRDCGELYTRHPLRVAAILAEVKMDSDTIIASLLHGVLELEKVTAEQIEEKFGKDVSVIVDGTTRITNLKIKNKTLQQADSVRKMLFAMIDDIRVILVKLADRLDRLRNLKGIDSEIQKSIAQEVLDVWAPLANRLGMSSVKDELEDLSLKYTNPDVYAQIKQLVTLKKDQRAVYLEKAQKEIYKAAAKAGIEITINSRAKHFYSIYQKMRKRGKAADEILDLLAIRILCETQTECYTLIGLVHNLWKPMDGRFKDYIAMPKANGYQSLHTTVMCDGFPLEIQIRTNEMHFVAEHGVASHWLYKKGTNRDKVSVDNLSIINQLKELRKEHGNDAELFAEIREELLGDSIYVFTPNGDIRELPAGATAIDFAYSIHSHIGEKIVGAKANGHIIPLSSPLKNTEIIEILTSPQAHPTVNQLHSVKTQKARSKIRAWLLQNSPELKLDSESISDKHTNPNSQTHQQLVDGVGAAQREKELKGQNSAQVPGGNSSGNNGNLCQSNNNQTNLEPIRIRIGDTTNFMVNLARCCHPTYEDDIIGYVSRGRGLIIHRKDCSNFSRIPYIKERSIDVVWEEKPITVPRSTTQKTKKKSKKT